MRYHLTIDIRPLIFIFFILPSVLGSGWVEKRSQPTGWYNAAKIEGLIYKRISAQTRAIQSQWSVLEIKILSQSITLSAKRLRIDPRYLIALLETESNFNQRAFRRNVNGSADRGLWQQNDCCANDRHVAVYGKKIKTWHYYSIRVSTRLMEHTFRECAKYKNEWAVVCYNLPRAAQQRRITPHLLRWRKKLRYLLNEKIK